jgi:hypothetical protein
MLPLRALLLWSLVSMHVAGGALLFRRLFGRDHDWYGFLIPGLALCLGLNFLEYFIAVPTLLWLLPLTTIGSLLLLVRPDFDFRAAWRRIVPGAAGASATRSAPVPFSWEGLRLPLGIFLGSFAFTFLVRCLQPNVLASSDGLADLNLIANFLKGETLPPTDGWMPPFKLEYYYTFQHYAASVLTRLFGVAAGTGYNLAHALLSAFVCFVAAATAWRIAGRVWITVAMPFLIESAATGSNAYLRLTELDPSPWTMSNLSGGLEHPDGNPIWKLLATAPFRERLELQPPGYWTWRDEYHPNAGGQFLTLFAVWILVELFRKERLNWPWIAAFLLPFFALITSTWALPITGLLCGGGLLLAYTRGRRAENAAFVFGTVALGLICMWPSLMPLFSSPIPTPVMWNHHEWRTPLIEFLIQWWPVIILWVSLVFVWPRLSTPVKWATLVVPLMLIGIENINIEDGRYNTIEKMWGYTYGAGLVAFFSAVAMRRAIAFRLVTVIILASASVALFGWMRWDLHWTDWSNAWHLEGDGILRQDPQRTRLLQVLSQFHRKTVLTGKVDWDYYDSPALAVFSGNRDYIAWTWAEEHYGHQGENDFRAAQVNDFYAGKTADPLGFLTGNSIQAVVIWPDDKISDNLLATLKTKLAPNYVYVDCRGDGSDNAGVFLRQPAPRETPPES